MSGRECDFHMEEFSQLKTEISILLSRVESLFKYGLISSAGIYSWFLTRSAESIIVMGSPKLILFGWLIPPVLVLFFGLLALSTYKHVSIMGEYIRKLELAMGYSHLGWEKYWKMRESSLFKLLVTFYLLLMVVEFGVAGWMFFHVRPDLHFGCITQTALLDIARISLV